MVVSVVVIIDHQLHSSITDQTTHDLAGEARLVALEWQSATNADSLADAAGVATGHRVTLIDSAGHVIGDSEFDGPALQALENHNTRSEVVAAHETGTGSSRRMSPSTGEEQLYVAVKSPRGVARVSVTTRTIEDLFGRARNGVLTAGVISFLLTAILETLFRRHGDRGGRASTGHWRRPSPGRSPTCVTSLARLPPVSAAGILRLRPPAKWAISPMQFTDCRNNWRSACRHSPPSNRSSRRWSRP